MSQEIDIDPEFRALLPALRPDELKALETNIVRDGCREPLTVWNGLLADGHNRYEICTRRDVHFQVHYLDLPDRDAVMLWMLDNQGGRRNLSDIDRIAIASKKEVIIARRAKENQIRKSESVLALAPKQTEPINTRAESAKAAGVGEKKYADGKIILQAVETGEAPPELLDQVRAGEVSIKRAAREIREAKAGPQSPASGKPAKNNYRPEYGVELARKAILTLERITKDDREFEAGHRLVLEFCERQLTPKK